MSKTLVNRIILIIGLLLFVSYIGSKYIKQTQERTQACVLYGTNENSGFPIEKQKCVDIHLSVNCDEKAVDSENSSKIWRSYPTLNCSSPNIKTGLSERYLLEGVD